MFCHKHMTQCKHFMMSSVLAIEEIFFLIYLFFFLNCRRMRCCIKVSSLFRTLPKKVDGKFEILMQAKHISLSQSFSTYRGYRNRTQIFHYSFRLAHSSIGLSIRQQKKVDRSLLHVDFLRK